MGVFSRFKDIIGANINAMLDSAEDPEKMIRVMIQEMEETLVELKSSCAGIMADRKKAERDIDTLMREETKWKTRAELAIAKGREDLAKEALIEKNRFSNQKAACEENLGEFDLMIENARKDIGQLEEKIASAREKQQLLIKRHIRAGQRLRTQKEIRRAGSADAFRRFEEFERKIDRMEAEAGLVNGAKKAVQGSLDDEFSRLENEESVEEELAALKKNLKKE
jgi:phage shock protein A